MFQTAIEEKYKDGDIIFEEGSSGDWIYVVESGAVEISKIMHGEKEVLLELGPGEIIGELGFITKGLADFFEADFSNISSLKVVERDKIDFILKEIELSEKGKVDASTAVRVGKLLGAQLMIFGSIVQLDKNNTKMLCKVVKVETSEILTSVEREGKPDYFKMEKDMVMELAEKLNLALSDDTQELIKTSNTESTDAATLYARGLFHMDKYDYKKAYEYFKKAYDLDNTFVEAKQKMDIYQPLAA